MIAVFTIPSKVSPAMGTVSGMEALPPFPADV